MPFFAKGLGSHAAALPLRLSKLIQESHVHHVQSYLSPWKRYKMCENCMVHPNVNKVDITHVSHRHPTSILNSKSLIFSSTVQFLGRIV